MNDADPAVAGAADGSPTADEAKRGPRVSRRARRPAPSGVDPTPSDHALTSRATEDLPEGWGAAQVRRAQSGGGSGENDARLKADKPPHWG